MKGSTILGLSLIAIVLTACSPGVNKIANEANHNVCWEQYLHPEWELFSLEPCATDAECENTFYDYFHQYMQELEVRGENVDEWDEEKIREGFAEANVVRCSGTRPFPNSETDIIGRYIPAE